MKHSELIGYLVKKVREELESDSTGHDWWHTQRVWNWAKSISAREGGDRFIIELAALLHDIADWKFYEGDETVGPLKAQEILKTIGIESEVIERVVVIIQQVSFKGAEVENQLGMSIEAKIVQDADRLDALGAIGIARTFAYGGAMGRKIYDPEIQPILHQSGDAYKTSKSPSINHFYEKLLLLRDRMNTDFAKEVAKNRHIYLESFLEEFYKEWNCES